MLPIFSTKKARERRARLAVERKLISPYTTGFQKTPGDIEWHSESWVRMWVDKSYVVFSECGLMFARRGVTVDGQIIWLVKHLQRSRAFHAVGHDPIMAFRRATESWKRCDEMRRRRHEITALVHDLLFGRKTFEITIEDAAASPLSAVEVRSFLTRVGLGRRRRIPGRLAALAALIEPQVGVVILTAAHRRAQERAPREVDIRQALA